MTDKLSIYKGALRVLGERSISSLTEARPSRYVLDEIWDNNFRNKVLLKGLWNFAIRTVEIQYTSDITTDFGPDRAFEKPSDWLRTAALSAYENFDPPLTERTDSVGYWDEQGYWFANYDTLYVKYVSNNENYGYDLSLWPGNVVEAAEHYMAYLAAPRITQSRVKSSDLKVMMEDAFTEARATDAMNQPTALPPQGTWAGSRLRGGTSANRRSGGWEF